MSDPILVILAIICFNAPSLAALAVQIGLSRRLAKSREEALDLVRERRLAWEQQQNE